MVGYPDKKNRVLSEWHKLFIQKNNTHLNITNKYWERIKTLGLPTYNKDHWQYSTFEEFLSYNFDFAANCSNTNISQYKKLGLSINAYRLVFINGQFSPELSDQNIDPWIIKINQNLDRHETNNPIQPEIFLYLTEYLSEATIHITLPTKKITQKPLYLLHLNEGSNIASKLTTSHYNYHLEIEHNSDAYVIEHFINTNKNSPHFSGARMSMQIGDHAKLKHIKLIFENHVSYHIAHNDIVTGQYSNVNSSIFTILGPKFTRHQTSVRLNYAKSSVSLNSLTFLSMQDIGDIRTYLEHNNTGHTLSRQLHKIIACNCSTGMFNGLIKVNPNSIKTDGKMINNNLLLHNKAKINSVPQLEIYSEDVKCSHGATIGQINTEHLFYLNTRGIPNKDAIKMLIHAFSIEIIESIQNTLLKEKILKKINQALIGITIQ